MTKALVCAVRLLARREHGAHELTQKLLQKGYADDEVRETIAECQRLGLQSDVRYVDSICRVRIQQGYGSLRIRQELRNKQLDPDLIEQALQQEQDNWFAYAEKALRKKYKRSDDQSYATLQKQKQYLFYRGFSSDVITMVLNHDSE